jgi:mono/diheme cytochrome c family protein
MRLIALCLGLLLVLTCTESEQVPADPSYSSDVQPLFNTSCLGCHGSGQQNGNYRLDSRTGAMGEGSDPIPNVIPGEPDSSKLYQRLDLGTMPPSGPWDEMKVQTVKNWISEGAKDN